MILQESTLLTENLTEDFGGKKTWFTEGVFCQSEVVVKNRRLYPKAVMEKACSTYIQEYVATDRAVGELEHPPVLKINPENVAIKIESLRQEGSDWYGKARVLNTPKGKILQALMEGGVRLGVSTRGSGSLKANSQGIPVVQDDYVMLAIDSVYAPSAPKAFVQGLMEGVDLIWDTNEEDIMFLESIRGDIVKASSKQLAEAQIAAFAKFMNHLKG